MNRNHPAPASVPVPLYVDIHISPLPRRQAQKSSAREQLANYGGVPWLSNTQWLSHGRFPMIPNGVMQWWSIGVLVLSALQHSITPSLRVANFPPEAGCLSLCLAHSGLANSVAGMPKRRRTILPLPEEHCHSGSLIFHRVRMSGLLNPCSDSNRRVNFPLEILPGPMECRLTNPARAGRQQR